MSTILDHSTDSVPVPGIAAAPEAAVASFADAIRLSMTEYVQSLGGAAVYPQLGGLRAVIVNLQYPTQQESAELPVAIDDFEYANHGSVEQELDWNDNRATTVESTVAVTTGIEAGVSAGFAIPAINLGIGVDVTASLSTTETQVLTTEQQWEWDLRLKVPPHTLLTARALLARAEYDLGFTAQVRIEGSSTSCVCSAMFPGGVFKVFSNSPGGWFRQAPVKGFVPDGTAVLFGVAGTMNDVQGTRLVIEVHEVPLPPAAADAAPRSYRIDDVQLLPRVLAVYDPRNG